MELHNSTLAIISHKRHHVNGTSVAPLTRYSHPNFCCVTGGFQKITNQISNHFQQVHLCVPTTLDASCHTPNLYHQNIVFSPLPLYQNRAEMLRQFPVILRSLLDSISHVDMVYAMGPTDMGLIGILLAKFLNKPLFVSIDTNRAERYLVINKNRGVAYSKYIISKLTIERFIKLTCRNIPTFFTGDPFLGHRPAWHTWVKHTLRTDEFPALPTHLPRKDSQSKSRLVFAGRLAAEKNISCLIEAVYLLIKSGRNVELVIIGEGNQEANLRQLVQSLQLQANVFFKGYVSQEMLIQSHFYHADIFVLPSLMERQGKVLLEAMSCGIPVIASNADGIPSVIKHEINGILFDPRHPKDLADKIMQLISDPQKMLRLIQTGYEFAQDHALDVEVQNLVHKVESFFSLDTKS